MGLRSYLIKNFTHESANRHAQRAEKDIQNEVLKAIQTSALGNNGEAADLLEYYRGESQFEMNVLGTRVSWLLAAQAFLVTASVIALSNAVTRGSHRCWILSAMAIMISIVGFMIARRSSDAMDRAKETVSLWLQRIKSIADAHRGVDGIPDKIFMARILGRWLESAQADENTKDSTLADALRAILHPLFTKVGPIGPNDAFHHESMQFSNLMPRLFAWYWVIVFLFASWTTRVLYISSTP